MNYYGSGLNQQNALGGVAHNPEGMRNALAPDRDKDTLGRRLDALEQSISGLSCMLDQLDTGLSPVLMPEPPQAEKEGVHPRPAISPAMEMVDNQINRIEYQTRRIGNLLRRLAL